MILVECFPHDFEYFIEAIKILVDNNIACQSSLKFVKEFCTSTETKPQYFVFKDLHDNYDICLIEEIFDIESVNYDNYEYFKELNIAGDNFSGIEFYEEILIAFNMEFNVSKTTNTMPVSNKNVMIPLEIAKEMYKSENKTIRDYVLTIYKESELKDPPYAKYKTVEDIVGYNDMINSTGPNFLTLLREKLNEGIKINYLKDPIYIPIIKVVENRYADDYLEDQIREKFSINGKQYCLVTGTKNEYLPINGLFNIQQDSLIGAVSLHCGYLAFASVEIAMHAAKYFAKEIFEATMWGYSKDIVVKWLMND